jgi:hypothetical protein
MEKLSTDYYRGLNGLKVMRTVPDCAQLIIAAQPVPRPPEPASRAPAVDYWKNGLTAAQSISSFWMTLEADDAWLLSFTAFARSVIPKAAGRFACDTSRRKAA